MANTDTSTNEGNASDTSSEESGSTNVEFKDVENKEDSAGADKKQGEKSDSDANSDESKSSDKEQKDSSGDDANKDQDSDKDESKKEEEGDVDIQLPEGSLIKDKAEFLGVLKDAVNSQEGFDKLMEFVSKTGEDALVIQKEADDKAWADAQVEWEKELKSDSEFGKDYSGNVELAKDTANDIDPDFGKWLEEKGLDKNPIMAKAMAKIGRERADAEVHMGGKNSANDNNKDRNGNTKVHFKDVDNS